MSAQAHQHQDYQPHLSVYKPAPKKQQARAVEAMVLALFLVWMGVSGAGIFGNHATESGLNTGTSGIREGYRHSTDHEGSTNVITDQDGKIVWDGDYEAFGSVVRSNGTLDFTPSFTGKQFDADTGLYYYNARWYDPTLGRFITEDPARSGDNWEIYANDSPLVFVDPTGLDPVGSTPSAVGPGDSFNLKQSVQQFGQGINNFAKGFNDQASATGQGMWDAVTKHPGETATGLLNGLNDFVSDPIAQTVRLGKETVDTVSDAGKAMASGDFGKAGAATASIVPLIVTKGEGSILQKDLATTTAVTGSYGELRAAGVADAHHIIQDAAVRDVPGYSRTAAPAVQMAGPSTKVGTQHYPATQAQRGAGGGTYGAERGVAYHSLLGAGFEKGFAKQLVRDSDQFFMGSLGLKLDSPFRIPGNRQ